MSSYDNADGITAARELIPARIRKAIYAGAALLGYGLAAVAVGLTTAGAAVPEAVTVSLAVLGALTGPLGQLAATNVPAGPVALPDPSEGQGVEDMP